ncbi:NADPH dehydrogenase NamA [Lysinibacillus telephonicus]|uniref:NADPH dehydrogenase NamA n=1 Tax=Lysinibacillus telephonicus TaxID=1714840 RepID=A0A3S0QVY8_9BACI|nr:NADPH dehydrogenase NamA [Lysinibacillus telephonicus]RTQ93416.1 NADPH dehydrogenase NamA [Lysinibacillus telephonicus]
MAKLFEPYSIRNVELKNRIVMSPMCMYQAKNDGFVTDFHITHYTSRAVGQVGLIILESTGVIPEGRISENDLGIWSDEHIEGLSKIVSNIKAYGAKAGIQISHAGRKSTVNGDIYAPSAIAFNDTYKTPIEMTKEDISKVVEAFANAAVRVSKAGFDVIEIHAAHGYLINEFLSPLTNKRTDEYGGAPENRYRFLREILDAIRAKWQGPLFVRITANEYAEGGLTPEDFIQFARWMKSQEVDLIDVSSGGNVPVPVESFPLYQVPFSETIKHGAEVATGAVGLITSGEEAEQILQQNKADLIFIARELLRDPYFPYRAAQQLDAAIEAPNDSYKRGW